MALTATAVAASNANTQFDVTVVINNLTRVVTVSIDDLGGPPFARLEFDEALKTILKAMWYGTAGTAAQKVTALKAGVNLATASLKIRDFQNGVDITS